MMPKTQKDLFAISVQFTVLTPDQLKEIKFGLSKREDGEVDQWKINFKLSTREKKTDPFEVRVEALVDADVRDAPLAEETAIKGPNKAQTDHLTLNAAAAAERFAAGKIKESTLNRTVKATLPARTA